VLVSFLLVVVAGNPLYTTTTSGLCRRPRFWYSYPLWLQTGCGRIYKQNSFQHKKTACCSTMTPFPTYKRN